MVDIWSSGIILFAMICGYLPFDDNNNDVLYKKIASGDFKIPNFISDKAKDLIRRILNTDPQKRYNIMQIRNHQWFNLTTPSINEGLLLHIHKIPIDEVIIKKLEDYGFPKEECYQNIILNKHDHITTTYYLILKKMIREGKTSVADLISKEFIEFIHDHKNLLEYQSKNKAAELPNKEKKEEREKIGSSTTLKDNISTNKESKESFNKSMKTDNKSTKNEENKEIEKFKKKNRNY